MTKNKSVKFLIVGDGELMSQLQKTVDLEGLPIQFLGWRDDIPAVLNASDMVLLVSDNEGVPLVLIEAAQAGLPIVTTAAGSVGDIAINGKNAIVTSFAPKDLAEAILKLAESATLCESMGNAGKLISAEQFSIKQMVDKHRDLYRKVLSPD
jgi:glycosyltransferase involved in cell wall biosynthesis